MTNFIQFSQVITQLTDEEVRWLMRYIEHRHRGLDIEGNERDYDDDGVYPDFGFKILQSEEWGQYAWFYAQENGNIAQVAETVQDFLKTTRPKSSFSMTWAEYADKLRPEQFDGGAVFVTKDDIKTFHAGEWVRLEQMKFLGHRLEESSSVL